MKETTLNMRNTIIMLFNRALKQLGQLMLLTMGVLAADFEGNFLPGGLFLPGDIFTGDFFVGDIFTDLLMGVW